MADLVEYILEHHGVKGMRWGHRKSESTSNSSGTTGVSPEAVQLAVIGTVLAAHGAYRLVDSGRLHQFSSRNTPFKTNPDLARKNMSVNTLHKTVVKPINPDFGKTGTKMNCRRCTFAYEMRRRGLDVKATTTTLATGQTSTGLIKAINPKGSPLSESHKSVKRESKWGETKIGDQGFSNKNGTQKSDEIFKALNSQPHGSRGELAMGWKFGGGHSVAYENVKGKSVIFDTQSGKTYQSAQTMAKDFGTHLHEAAYTRLDNKDLNAQFLRRWVTNVE